MAEQTTNGPVFRRKIGAIEAAVFERSHEGKTFYSTEITRSFWSDKDGKWRNSSSFNHDDLRNVARLAELACDFILSKQNQNGATASR